MLVLVASAWLSACTSMVEFKSTPPGAAVTYQGKVLGTTPFKTGISDDFGWWSTYSFTASQEGYEPATLVFRERTPLDAQQIIPGEVAFTLTPKPVAAAAAKPAAPVVPAAVAAAAPGPILAPQPPAPPPDPRPAVEAAVRAWAAAWSQRDMVAYLAAYEPSFSGQLATRQAWEKVRHQRIAGRKQISVILSDLQVSTDGNQARATFAQAYASGALKATDRKTLELRRNAAGRWLIHSESVGS
ncbi:MAG: hypothetical protein IV094_23360 [Vitreoscilla sp.]|nr:hypothetical protein [Vitreoscilla sp.]